MATGRGRWRSRGLRAATRGRQVGDESAAPQGVRGRRVARPLASLSCSRRRPVLSRPDRCGRSRKGRQARVAPLPARQVLAGAALREEGLAAISGRARRGAQMGGSPDPAEG